MSNKRKLRQRNGGKLTRDRQEWTHKERLGHGSAALMSKAGSTGIANRDRLAGIAGRTASNGAQAVKGGQAIKYREFLAIDYRESLLAAIPESARQPDVPGTPVLSDAARSTRPS